ncbi:MAG: hypothetical protein R2789_19400 [Microthrixaceae bacterium]
MATRCSSHGFNVRFGYVKAPASTWPVVAPKGPGHLVRRTYTEGGGVPCLIAVAQDASGNAKALALSYADAIGGTRAGVLETTPSKKRPRRISSVNRWCSAVACPLWSRRGSILSSKPAQPESAYFECLHELKLIVDLMYEQGISGMRYSISTTAEYGDLTRGPRIITDETKAEMKRILDEIRSGEFAEEFIGEVRSGGPLTRCEAGKEHQVEQVGTGLRKMMPWISAGKTRVE